MKWPDEITVDGIEKAFQARWDSEGVHKTFRLPTNFLTLDADDQVLLLVDLERDAAGVPPYQRVGGALLKVTRKLADEGRVSHDTMDQRIAAAGLPPGNVGEAIASGATPAGAVFGWMYHDSDPAWGHRRGIIDPKFTYVSVAHGNGKPQWTGREMMPIQIYGLNYGLKSYQEPSSSDGSPVLIGSPAGSSSGTTSSKHETTVPGPSTGRSGAKIDVGNSGGAVVGLGPGEGSGTDVKGSTDGTRPGPAASSSATPQPTQGSARGGATSSSGGQRLVPPGSGSGQGASSTVPGGEAAPRDAGLRARPQDPSSPAGRILLTSPVEPAKPQRILTAEEHQAPVPSQGYRIPPAEQPKPQRILLEEHHDPAPSPAAGTRIAPPEQPHPYRIPPVEPAKPQRILPAEEHHDPAPSPAIGTRMAPPEQLHPNRIPPAEQPKPQRIPPEEHHDPAPSRGYRIPPAEQPKPQRILPEEHHAPSPAAGTRIVPPEQPKPQRILPSDPHASSGTGARVTPPGTGGGGRVEKVDAPLRDLGATPTRAQVSKAFQAQWDTRYPGRTFELPEDFEYRTPQEQMVTLVNLERGAAGLEPMRLGAGPLANAAQDRATRGVPTLGRQYLDGLAGHYRASAGIATASAAVAVYRWMYLSPHDQRPKQAIMDKELTWAGIGVGKTQGGSPFITVDLARGSYDDTRAIPSAPTAAIHQSGPTQWHAAPTQQYPGRMPPVGAAPVGYGPPPRKGMKPVVKGAIAVGVVGAAIVGAVALVTGTSVLGGTTTPPNAPTSVSNVVAPGQPLPAQVGSPVPGSRVGSGAAQQPATAGGTRVAPGSAGAASGSRTAGGTGGVVTGGGAAGAAGTGGGAVPNTGGGESADQAQEPDAGSSSGGEEQSGPPAVRPDVQQHE